MPGPERGNCPGCSNGFLVSCWDGHRLLPEGHWHCSDHGNFEDDSVDHPFVELDRGVRCGEVGRFQVVELPDGTFWVGGSEVVPGEEFPGFEGRVTGDWFTDEERVTTVQSGLRVVFVVNGFSEPGEELVGRTVRVTGGERVRPSRGDERVRCSFFDFVG